MLKHLYTIFFIFFCLMSTAVAENTCAEKFELSTQGKYVVDQCGNRFKLKSVNWYGAHEASEVVGGLHKQPLINIVNLIKRGGFTSVRLTYSNKMLHNTNSIDPHRVKANPELIGKTPFQIFDVVVKALTDAGIVVILNNHTTLSEWCCGYDYNGLWHHPYAQSTTDWIKDWVMLAEHYKSNPLVAGFDLRNEVRTTRYYNTYIPVFPNWGLGDKNDWKLAATQAGNEIHRINPKLLIIIEGINWFGVPMINGYRPLLAPIKDNPIKLRVEHKLVYEIHNYSYTGPKHIGDSRVSRGQLRYADMDKKLLYETFDREFGYVVKGKEPYTAPVWLGEFGISSANVGEKEKAWWHNLADYLIDNEIGFAYWALNSEKGDGSTEGYGLVNEDWSDYKKDWRQIDMQRLLQN